MRNIHDQPYITIKHCCRILYFSKNYKYNDLKYINFPNICHSHKQYFFEYEKVIQINLA